jgi:hypothetical protein
MDCTYSLDECDGEMPWEAAAWKTKKRICKNSTMVLTEISCEDGR